MTQGSTILIALGLLCAGCVANAPGGSDPSGSDPGGGGGSGGGDGGGGGGTYSWITGAFGACSAVCDGGVSVRIVTCVDGSGAAVSDSLCTDAKPDVTEACNTQSCSNIVCTPYFNAVNPVQMIAISPASGAGPLTVTFDMGVLSQYVWDYIDFGDGSTFPGESVVFQNLPGPGGGGAFACVNHTFVSTGTYSVGRHDPDTGTVVYEVTVTVQ